MNPRIHVVGPWVAAVSFLFSVILFVTVLILLFIGRENVDKKLCEGTVENRAAVRVTWNAARDFILSGQTQDRDINITNDFFNAVLLEVPPLRCEGNVPVEVQQ